MSTKSIINLILLSGLIIPILLGCKKETPKVIPTLKASSVTNITSQSVTAGGEVTSDGGAEVTVRGVCWSATNKTPTTADGNIGSGRGLGSFTSSITGLSPGTIYFVNAYATNSIGTAYSGTTSFTTLGLAPVITTTELSLVTTTNVTGGGNVTNDGGAPVTARGVCWSINQNPTVSDNKTSDGVGTGTFTSNITNFVPGATYYFRAYATNNIGTTYGNQVTTKIPCHIPQISDINKRTSHYKKYNIPFYDFYNSLGIPLLGMAINGGYSDIFARGFLDINNNDIPDIVAVSNFWPGTTKGSLYIYIDNKVSKIIPDFAQGARKMLISDFNGDGRDDVFILDVGIEQPPWSGGTTKLVFLTSNDAVVKVFPDVAYFHGGCAGDVDNDGDIDIYAIGHDKAQFLYINDGNGNFQKKSLFDNKHLAGYNHCEFYDLNKDGNLDLIIGGHEWYESWKNIDLSGIYENHILWGNGKGDFSFNNSLKLPTIKYYGTITDIDCYDLDNDGVEEVIITRTGGAEDSSMETNGKMLNGFYKNFKIQILKKSGNNYVEFKVLDQPMGWIDWGWMRWVDVYDIDGDCNLDIVTDYELANVLGSNAVKEFNNFRGLYYKGDGKGNFVIAYKK